MRYLIALLCPPLGVLLCGKPFQAILNLFLSMCFYFPGALHALLVVSSTLSDGRHRELIAVTKKQTKTLEKAIKGLTPTVVVVNVHAAPQPQPRPRPVSATQAFQIESEPEPKVPIAVRVKSATSREWFASRPRKTFVSGPRNSFACPTRRRGTSLPRDEAPKRQTPRPIA
jgi:uncharacterized membrane protein YqaE (UPF0057 family)